MEGKELPSTGLEKYSIDELREGMGVADEKGYWKGVPQGKIGQELAKRLQLTEKPAPTVETPPLKNKSGGNKRIINFIDGSSAMRGIGRNRGNR